MHVRRSPLLPLALAVLLLPLLSPRASGASTSAATQPNDPLFAADDRVLGQWGLLQIRAVQAWQNSTGSGAVIAVVDSGIDLDHEDLATQVVPGKTFTDCGVSGCGNGDWESGSEPKEEHSAHGTHVAGIAAAATNNGKGVAGVAPDSKVLAVKVATSAYLLDAPCFSETFADIARGIRWAADNGAHVINLSLGHPVRGVGEACTELDPAVSSAIGHAHSKGVVVVAAAGNDTFPVCAGQPAFTEGVLCVTATDSHEAPADYSNGALKAELLAVAAPGGGSADFALFCGGGILSTVPPGEANGNIQEVCDYPANRAYDEYLGTSMAAPHVAGLAALLAAQGCTRQQTLDIITSSARQPLTELRGVFTPSFGYGIVDAAAATSAGADCGGSSTVTHPTAIEDAVRGLEGSSRVAEGTPGSGHVQGAARFTVSLPQPATGTINVSYATANGTAIEPADYQRTGGVLTFAAGEKSKLVTVPVSMDAQIERDEQFFLQVSSVPSGTTVNGEQRRGRATVVNDDPTSTATLSVGDLTVTEGNAGTTTTAAFTVSLSKPSAGPVSVRVVTIGGTAHVHAGDFAHVDQVISFAPNEMTRQVPVTVFGDNMEEPDESLFLQLDKATGAVPDKRIGRAVIRSDDNTTISINDVSVREGSSGTTTQAIFTISLSDPTYRQVSVNYSTADGTTRSSSSSLLGAADYTPVSGTATFAPGDSTKTVVVALNGDATLEPDEEFVVQLSGMVNAIAAKRVGLGTILNDD